MHAFIVHRATSIHVTTLSWHSDIAVSLACSGNTLHGWIDLTSGKDALSKKAIKYFDDVLKLNEGERHPLGSLHSSRAATQFKSCPAALFGKLTYLLDQKGDLKRSLDILNQAIVIYKGYLPALIEKSKVASRIRPGSIDGDRCCLR